MDKVFKKDFIKGSLMTAVGAASSMIFQFLSITLIIRIISKEDFGIYALVLVIANFLNIFSGLGLEMSIVKFISSIKELEKKFTFAPTIIIRLSFIAVNVILLIIFGNDFLAIFNFTATNLLPIIIILFVLSNFRDLFYNLLQGLNLFRKYALVQIVTSILRVAILIVIILLKKLSLQSILLIEVYVVLFAVLLQLSLIPYKLIFHWKLDFDNIIRILRFSLPLYLTSLLSIIYNQVSIFIIGLYLNPASIASYDVANKIPLATKKGFQSFIIVFYPNVSKLFSKGETDNAIILINKSLFTFSIVINLLVFLCFIFNKEIILLLFSEKYLSSTLAFSLLIVAFYFNSISNIMGYSLVSAGLPAVNLKISIISSAISLLGAIIMVPTWGFMGAVYSFVLATFSSLLFNYLYLIKYKMRVDISMIIKPSLITILGLSLYYILNIGDIIYKCLLFIVYISIIYFFVPEIRLYLNKITNRLLKKDKNILN